MLIHKLTAFHKCTHGRYFIVSFEMPLVKYLHTGEISTTGNRYDGDTFSASEFLRSGINQTASKRHTFLVDSYTESLKALSFVPQAPFLIHRFFIFISVNRTYSFSSSSTDIVYLSWF